MGGTETSEPTSSNSPTSDDKQPVKTAQAAAGTTFFPGLPASEHAGYASGSSSTPTPPGQRQPGGQRRRRLLRRQLQLRRLDRRHQERDGPPGRVTDARRRHRLRTGQRPRGRHGHRRERPNQIVLPDTVEAKAPPSHRPPISKDRSTRLDPILNAALLRGQAKSIGGAACTTGVDLSYGLGHVVDASLLARSPPAATSSCSTPRLPKG